MQLEPFVSQVAHQLEAAAALGDERTQEVARSLGAVAASAVRLAVLGAVGAAADEITAALLDQPGSPAVRVSVDGDEVRPEIRLDSPAPPMEEPATRDDGDATARISLRLSESLKSDVDAAAQRAGISVNSWLVRAASMALNAPSADSSAVRNAHRVSGWLNG